MIKQKEKDIKHIVVAILLIAIVLSAAFSGVILYMEHQSKHAQLNSLMNQQADTMKNNIHEALLEVNELQMLVLGAKGKDIDLQKMGEYLIQDTFKKYVRNVLIAPNGIVEQVYPLEGNEKVIGLNLYSDNNATNKEAKEASESRELVVTGPFQLVQGGQAISGRMAVYLPQENGTEINWGLVSVTLSFPEVMEGTATDKLKEQAFAYHLKKLDLETNSYQEVLNHGFEEGNDSESISFSVDSMKFVLEAYPINGWYDITKAFVTFGVLMLIISVLGLFAYIIYVRLRNVHIRAEIDELTGLTNRAVGERTINQLLSEKAFKKGAFVLVDIDYFKSVNDTFGHQCGDDVLIEAADEFKLIFHNSDVICRLGGDEFVVFVSFDSDKSFLEDKLKQLSHALRREISRDGKMVEISCSIGVSLAPKHGITFNELYESADKALYNAKEQGRDCAVCFDNGL